MARCPRAFVHRALLLSDSTGCSFLTCVSAGKARCHVPVSAGQVISARRFAPIDCGDACPLCCGNGTRTGTGRPGQALGWSDRSASKPDASSSTFIDELEPSAASPGRGDLGDRNPHAVSLHFSPVASATGCGESQGAIWRCSTAPISGRLATRAPRRTSEAARLHNYPHPAQELGGFSRCSKPDCCLAS